MSQRRKQHLRFVARATRVVLRVRRLSRHLASGEADLADDLCQEAMISIWRLPHALPPRIPEDAIVMLHARRAMIRYLQHRGGTHAGW